MSSNLSIYDEVAVDLIKTDIFKRNYEDLLKLQHLGTRSTTSLDLDQIQFLLRSASVFCFSDEFKQLAYKIAAILSERYSKKYGELTNIVQYIMICSGQIPVIKKIVDDGNVDYFSFYHESDIPFNPFLFKDIIIKQANNMLPMEEDTNKMYFTDFQSKSFNDLMDGESISLSAPTSAGKSFLLVAYLAKKIKEDDKLNVVYIVPTKALISQVLKDIKLELKKFDITDILISSSPKSYSEENSYGKKIFVLTQERFHNLLFDVDFNDPLHILIIDEAHKVSDLSRGIILEEVIEEAIKRYPNLQKIFLSPFSKNPEKFAEMFRLKDLKSEKTKLSPVSQNILKLDIESNNYSLCLSTAEFDKDIFVATDEILENESEKFSGIDDWQLLWATKKFGGDFNIIYCNSRKKCVDYAVFFSSLLPPHTNDNINEVISFLKEYVHKDYFLIKCLEKGVAYHYGGMPNQIRSLVEDLFKNKDVSYIFCTSTLLEGVNLPAQNIFIFKPKQGKPSMNRLNFWNLAGRAGRLLKDYYGNIFCINIAEWKGYKPDPKDVEHEIESILENVIIEKDKEIMEYLKGLYFNLKGKDKPIEQAVTKFVIQSMKIGETDFVEDLLKRNSKFKIDKLKAIKEEIHKMAEKIEIPVNVIQKNSSINPQKQQKLLKFFRENHPVVPLHPTDTNSFNNLKSIYKFINTFFLEKNDNTHEYLTPLTFNWLNDKSISELIKFKLHTANNLTEKMINKHIDDLFSDINDKIGYEYQKYLKCYIDILRHYYDESGYDSSIICENLPMYIEFGTYKTNVLILQSIGLSRSTAIAINPLVRGTFSDEMDCLKWIKMNMVLIRNNISRVLFKEVEKNI